MRIISGFIIREIASQTIAVPSGESARRLSGLISLNESGRLLFELLQTEQTKEGLVQAFIDAYDVDTATAQQDVSDFLTMLQDNGLLV